MFNVLILCAHRPKRSPSQRYRFEQYLPFLESKGFNFTFSYLLNEKNDKTFYGKGKIISKVFILLKSILIRLNDVQRFQKFDIIFIQREALFLGTSFFEKKAFKSGAIVIFDFDDSIWFADTSPENKKWEFIKKPEKFYKNISFAHVVIAGNQYLKEKAMPFNANTVLIPTTIDTEFHIPKPELRNKDYVTIGWSGSISTIKHFETLMPVLLKISTRFKEKVRFKIIGQTNYINRELKIECVNWSETNEVNELNTFDIGIMPLPNDEWANGKCGLKGLSYMACGVATIMSNFGVNSEIIRHGLNGFLAGTPEEWFTILEELIVNNDLRLKTGVAGRETVEKLYSVHSNASKYLNVFRGACD